MGAERRHKLLCISKSEGRSSTYIDDQDIRGVLNLPDNFPITLAHAKKACQVWSRRDNMQWKYTIEQSILLKDPNMKLYQVPVWFTVRAGNPDQAMEHVQMAFEKAGEQVPRHITDFGGVLDNEILGDVDQVIVLSEKADA